MSQLQVTACIFGSPFAFRLIGEGLSVTPSSKFSVRLTVLPQDFEVIHPII